MTQQTPCTCHTELIGKMSQFPEEVIVRCPLHDAAPALLGALKEVVNWADVCTVGDNEKESIINALAVIALATPGKDGTP